MMGRPTKYNEQILEKAQEYIDNPGIVGDIIPIMEGLAKHLGVSRRVLYDWGEAHPDFLHTLDEVQEDQKRTLINKGLEGEFNATITKLMLANHGLHDKQDITAAITQADEFEYVKPDEST